MPPLRRRERQAAEGGLDDSRERGSSRDRPRRLDYLPLGIVSLCVGIIFLALTKFSDDFAAEQAASRNRKFARDDPGREEISPADQRRLEQLLREHVRDVDVAALARACSPTSTGRILDLQSVNTRCAKHPVEPRVYMLGERHSGSNVAAALAYSNFALELEPVANIRKLMPGSNVDETVRKEWGMNNHKHNLQDDVAGAAYGGLAILAVRNAYDFIRSLHAQCYFCDPVNRKRDIDAFVSTPWTAGAHIERPYSDIFDLRRKKICNAVAVAATHANCLLIVRAEELVLPATQREYVQTIQSMTGWDLLNGEIATSGPTNVGRGRGERFSAADYFDENILFSLRSSREDNNEVVRAVGHRLDTAGGSTSLLEEALGYSRSDGLE